MFIEVYVGKTLLCSCFYILQDILLGKFKATSPLSLLHLVMCVWLWEDAAGTLFICLNIISYLWGCLRNSPLRELLQGGTSGWGGGGLGSSFHATGSWLVEIKAWLYFLRQQILLLVILEAEYVRLPVSGVRHGGGLSWNSLTRRF